MNDVIVTAKKYDTTTRTIMNVRHKNTRCQMTQYPTVTKLKTLNFKHSDMVYAVMRYGRLVVMDDKPKI